MPSAQLAPGALRGRSVLARGGTGAVGSAAVQLASWAGAHVVATVGSPEKADMAMAWGAAQVLDHRSPGHADELAEIAGNGFDGIVEVALTSNLVIDAAVLAPHGAIVTYATEQAEPQLPVRRFMGIKAALHLVLVYGLTPEMLRDATDDVTVALAADALTPLPAHRFPLEAIADADEAVERGVLGKVLIELGEEV